jgi:hypothetical protein
VLGMRLRPYPSGTVRCRAPQGALAPALRAALQEHKSELHALLEAFEERAAIAEHCGGLSRVDAERLAWETLLQKEMA